LHDQRHNAAQCERLGLGRTIMPADTTAERIAEVCADVLVDPTRRGDCRRMQRAVQALPGVDALVDAMQTLAVRDDPTPDRKERR
jgi:N-glycosyltransferase